MKKILLNGKYGIGKFTLVDDEDFEWLSKYKWFLTTHDYVARTTHTPRPNRIDKTVFMHRIVNNTPEGLFTDHINRNRLDNRKSNLRTVTYQKNAHNRNLQNNNKSGYAGINWQKPNKKWWVRIYTKKKQISLGCYIELEDAIKARKEGERKYYDSISF